MFAHLAPRCGLEPVYGFSVGTNVMRGGFSWANFGSALSSGIGKLGNFVGQTAKQIGNSEAFKQAKQGFLQSGVIENAGQLAGQAVSSLVDIGRLKLESDLQRLRDKVTSGQTPNNQDQLLELLKAAQQQQQQQQAPAPPPPSANAAPLPSDVPVALGPYEPPSDTNQRRRRKRRRATGWGAALDSLLGNGVALSSKRLCS